ncbi:lysosome membrane protein 2 [Drosophila biarmipes]|uniref:lysosome membrane protein 2 n=1 Tax=Drosophila biarmipes TaxID=125945 RepID=UPI0007E5D482|nr:lysosome membrane protein 2 [Drosophila biarmipes]
MKLFTNKNQRNAKLLRSAALGMTLLFFGSLVLIADPLQSILDAQLTLKPGALLHRLWLSPPLDVYINVYMFNYTNVDEFTAGRASKMQLQEVGPYVYQEILTNHDVTYNEANNTITYTPKREYIFIRERSVGDPKVDRIRAPNIPLMGVTTLASSLSMFAALGLSAITRQLDSQPMLEMTVHDYMWGYEDHLVELASRFVPSWIDFKSFGIMEKLFREGNESNVFNMNLAEPKDKYGVRVADAPRGYTVDSINGERGFKGWEYNRETNGTMCNRIWGSHDATLFPLDMDENDEFFLYRRTFCRRLPVKFNRTTTYNGIDGYEFLMEPDSFDSDVDNSNSSCYCKNNRCLKKGVGNVSPCYYNIPLAITYPHFMHADPSLLEPFEGLRPDEERFTSTFVVQPQLGAPMQGTHLRLQANQVVGKVNFNRMMSPFENMILPLLWVDLNIDVLCLSLRLLIHGIKWGFPLLQWGAALGMLLAGVYQLCSALLLCIWPSSRQFQKVDQVERGTAIQVIGAGISLATGLRKSSLQLDPEEQLNLLFGGGSFIPKLAKA